MRSSKAGVPRRAVHPTGFGPDQVVVGSISSVGSLRGQRGIQVLAPCGAGGTLERCRYRFRSGNTALAARTAINIYGARSSARP